jgi:hypothetical protein
MNGGAGSPLTSAPAETGIGDDGTTVTGVEVDEVEQRSREISVGWVATMSRFLSRFSIGLASAFSPLLSSVLSLLRVAWVSQPQDVDSVLRDADLKTLDQVGVLFTVHIPCVHIPTFAVERSTSSHTNSL